MSDKEKSKLVVFTFGCANISKEFRSQGLVTKSFASVTTMLGFRGEELPRGVLIRSTAIVGRPIEDVVRKLRSLWPLVDIVVWAPRCSADLVLEVIKAGAKDVVLHESSQSAVEITADIVRKQKLLPRVAKNQSSTDVLRTKLGQMVSQSPKMWDVFDLCHQVAPTEATVLLQGETGTGKELMARAIHQLSGKEGRYVAINCAGIPETLIDSELFGHTKGAFTGAAHDKKGLFLHAAGGSLFLDEIGNMPLPSQHHLLRVLQEGTFRAVGAHAETLSDARVIAAASQDLARLAETDRFREDLYYRLDVFRIAIPPLRERPEDIVFLFHYFAKRAAKRYKVDVPDISNSFLDAILDYRWPGNVRQLENFAERLILIHSNESLKASHFRKLLRTDVPKQEPAKPKVEREVVVDTDKRLDESLQPILERAERQYLSGVLSLFHGRIGDSAAHAGISRRTLLRKIKKYQLNKKHYREMAGK